MTLDRRELERALRWSNLPSHVQRQLLDLLAERDRIRGNRQRAAADGNRARADAIAAGIREAQGVLPAHARATPRLVQKRIANRLNVDGPPVYGGLTRTPNLKTIRAALRKEGVPVPARCVADEMPE